MNNFQGKNTKIGVPFEVLISVKLITGESEQTLQVKKAADDLYSTGVSKIRQPIENFLIAYLPKQTNELPKYGQLTV